MSNLSEVFKEGCKVVISPDKMRAWVSLARPKGAGYTAEAIAEWLPQKGVKYGADMGLIRQAAASTRYEVLLEVARGKAPVSAGGGGYAFKVAQKPFTGLSGGSDGALYYEDLSFLQEVQPGQVLAEITPPTEAEDGVTVTGESVAPRPGSPGRQLAGSGYITAQDGRSVVAPVLGHVNIVNEQLIVTPLKKVTGLCEADGELSFDGNVLVEGDVQSASKINASGSVFIGGRAVSALITAGNNVLISGGMRNEGANGVIKAKGSVWGLFFEMCDIEAGGDLCANHLSGCEVAVQGRASILGGRAAVISTTLYAKNGVVAGVLGDPAGTTATIACGLDKAFLDGYTDVGKKTDRLAADIQGLQQSIGSFERQNNMRPDRGKNDPKYKGMVQKRDQSLGVLNILEAEHKRMKRVIELASVTTVVAREVVYPGVTVVIDTRETVVKTPQKRVRFRRAGEAVEITAASGK